MSLARPLYRARQLFASLRTEIGEAERGEAAELLGERLFPLFEAMVPRDQRHCLDVLQTLQRQGFQDRDVLQAALLHDAGKGEGVRLWQRVAYVLLASISRGLLERLARRGVPFGRLRAGLAALHHHAERGAALAEQAGAAAVVVDLIRRHEEGQAEDQRLSLLRGADDSC